MVDFSLNIGYEVLIVNHSFQTPTFSCFEFEHNLRWPISPWAPLGSINFPDFNPEIQTEHK